MKQYDLTINGMPAILYIAPIYLIIILIGLGILRKNKTSLAFHAYIESPELTMIQGVDINKMLAIIWFVSGGVAGIAGGLFPMWFQSVPFVRPIILYPIIAGCLLGGMINIRGAIAGGFIMGVSELMLTYLAQKYINAGLGEFSSLIPMFTIYFVLLFGKQRFTGK